MEKIKNNEKTPQGYQLIKEGYQPRAGMILPRPPKGGTGETSLNTIKKAKKK